MFKTVPMNERVRAFDPDGNLVKCGKKVLELVGDKIDQCADAFVDAYLPAAGLVEKFSDANIANMRTAAKSYIMTKLTKTDSEEWAGLAANIVEYAHKEGIAPHILTSCLQKQAFALWDCVVVAGKESLSDSEIAAMGQTMSTISILETELVFTTVHEIEMREADAKRKDLGNQFDHSISAQLESASMLGDRLREQARGASAATRGMLDKASEVAAAAEVRHRDA